MRRMVESVVGVGNGAPLPVDNRSVSFGIGFGVVVTGTITYTVQHTFDDVYGGGTINWFPHSFVVAQTTNQDGNYAYPISAMRLITTAGTGTATLTVLSNSGQG